MEGLVKCSLALQGNASAHFNVERRKSILKHLKKDLKPLAEAEFQDRGAVRDLLQKWDCLTPDRPEGCLFSRPIYKDHHKYLRFIWADQTYEFHCLPFGLSMAPITFTKNNSPSSMFPSGQRDLMCDLLGRYAADVTVQDDPQGAHQLLSGSAGKCWIPGESPKISL